MTLIENSYTMPLLPAKHLKAGALCLMRIYGLRVWQITDLDNTIIIIIYASSPFLRL